jgi:hypothetical protein
MGIKSGGYNATLPCPLPFKYWALFAAIRRIVQDVPYPDVVDVMDSLMEPIQSPGLTTTSGVKPTRKANQ